MTAFDASFYKVDFWFLAIKKILETDEDVYHVWDWQGFKLPRVARSSLAAEAQAAGCASDATKFACRYYEHLVRPGLTLAELLKVRSSLAPAMITDANCLYDSYHKESMSAVDQRSGLEIRVVKKQLEGLGGRLLWVPSERKLGDGLTKMSVRQVFADKLRHGMVKFLFDPQYKVAKKKSLSERQAENSSSSKAPTSIRKKAKVIDLDPIPEESDAPADNQAREEIEILKSPMKFLSMTKFLKRMQLLKRTTFLQLRPSLRPTTVLCMSTPGAMSCPSIRPRSS